MVYYPMASKNWQPKCYIQYFKKMARQANGYKLRGYKTVDIARKMGVSRDTIYRWLYWLNTVS